MFIHFRWLLKIKCVLSASPGAHKRTTKIIVSICPPPKIILASSCQAYYHCVEYSISLSIIDYDTYTVILVRCRSECVYIVAQISFIVLFLIFLSV